MKWSGTPPKRLHLPPCAKIAQGQRCRKAVCFIYVDALHCSHIQAYCWHLAGSKINPCSYGPRLTHQLRQKIKTRSSDVGQGVGLTSHSQLTYIQPWERGQAGWQRKGHRPTNDEASCGRFEILKFIIWPKPNFYLFIVLIYLFAKSFSTGNYLAAL